MGKKVGSFTGERFYLLLVLVVCVMAIAGCETTKIATKGTKTGWQAAQQDASNFWQAIQTADEWIKANLW